MFRSTWYRFLLIMGASWSTCLAQPNPVPVEVYNFINYNADTLYIAKNQSLLHCLVEKFDSLIHFNTGNINMVHIGGSHVQAGTFPNTVRRELRMAYPELQAGRGMIFPYAAAPKCNNPIDYKTKSIGKFGLVRNVYAEHVKSLGIAGIAVYTQDSVAKIKILLCDSLIKFKTTKITLLGYTDTDSSSTPILLIDTLRFLPTQIIPEKRQFIYENICATDSFAFSFKTKNGASFTITGILLENDNPGIIYHSIGVNGASVNAFLRCEHFEEEIELLHPDMVIFGLGINDANEPDFKPDIFKENYLKLVAQFRKVNPECFFVFITNNDSFKKIGKKYQVNKNALEVRKIMYELADETGGALFDQFEIMGGLYSMEKWRLERLAQNDRVHFTKAGYELMGKLLFNAIARVMR